MASDPLSIELPEGIQDRLTAIVRATGKSESEVVSQALLEYYERQSGGPSSDDATNCYEIAEKSGFLGCDDGGPDDLSVNPQHMEGFGRE
jgi:hypothetical protein